jgi:hypothetical protein
MQRKLLEGHDRFSVALHQKSDDARDHHQQEERPLFKHEPQRSLTPDTRCLALSAAANNPAATSQTAGHQHRFGHEAEGEEKPGQPVET